MMQTGIVYTETVVHSAPEQFVHEAPYQLAIIVHDDGSRITARIVPSERVAIDDRVVFDHDRDGVAFYRKQG